MKLRTLQGTFIEIYERESDTIFRFCMTRTSNLDQSLDITQETFLRLWKAFINGKKIESIKPFLFKIARRLIIDWYRKKKSESLEALITGGSFSEKELPSNQLLTDSDLSAEGRYLLRAIENLSPVYREVIYLRFVEGLLPDQIGKILEISPNTASARISRGLSELRRNTGYEKEVKTKATE